MCCSVDPKSVENDDGDGVGASLALFHISCRHEMQSVAMVMIQYSPLLHTLPPLWLAVF
jgi:hypothetical protein